MQFNSIGAFIGLVLGVIIWLVIVKSSDNPGSWGSGAYVFGTIAAILGTVAGGFIVGAFVKENYENFHNETDEKKKKRLKKLN